MSASLKGLTHDDAMVGVEAKKQAGAALREVLQKEGLSQAEATAVGRIESSQLSRLINGAANPQITTLAFIAQRLGYRVVIKYERL